jgi:hypothetical protein
MNYNGINGIIFFMVGVAGYDHIEQTQELMTSIIHELVHAGDIGALREELKRDKSMETKTLVMVLLLQLLYILTLILILVFARY